MKRLTKEDILKGKEQSQTLHVESYDADVVIRPLTDGELSEVLAILGSLPLKSDGTPDTGKVDVTKNLRALRLAASLGMIDPKLSLDEVAEMKFGIPELIGTEVLEISGISSQADVQKKKLN